MKHVLTGYLVVHKPNPKSDWLVYGEVKSLRSARGVLAEDLADHGVGKVRAIFKQTITTVTRRVK